ncbi:MAG: hypothetical protein CM1200mP26_02110 [Acidimicrobiales bacterium]|nr:MAG: hypothetical protein CM1200mP26_02110 [Acidimicrobiales bacterium]
MTGTDVKSGWAGLGCSDPRPEHLGALTDATCPTRHSRSEPSRRSTSAMPGPWLSTHLHGGTGLGVYVPTEFALGAFDTSGGPVDRGPDPGRLPRKELAANGKGYRHWGDDIAEEDTPLHAGLSWGVAFDKPGGFIGRDALVAQRERGCGPSAGAVPAR